MTRIGASDISHRDNWFTGITLCVNVRATFLCSIQQQGEVCNTRPI